MAALRHHSEVIKVLRYYHADVYTQNKVTVAISQTHWWLGVSLYVWLSFRLVRLPWTLGRMQMMSRKRCSHTASLQR